MKTKAFFVHGFNVSDNGDGTVGRLVPYFASLGCATKMVSYGHFNLFEPRFKNSTVAIELCNKISEAKRNGYRVIVVAHSNGCAIAHKAGMMGAQIDKAVFISAALDCDVTFPDNMRKVDVWHSRGDWVLRLAKWLPFNRWGDMGRVGASKYRQGVRNFDRSQNYETPSALHSDLFKSPLVEYFGPIIASEALG